MRPLLVASLALSALAALHCNKPSEQQQAGPAASVSSAAPAPSAPSDSMVASKPGDREHGVRLLAEHECNRCHGGLGAAPEPSKDCVGCHVDIVAGKPIAKPDALAKWKPIVAPLTEVPSLVAADSRYTRAFLESFLRKPHDLRPNLVQTMPRFDLSRQDIKDIAAALVPAETPPSKATGNLANGRKVLESKGCASCHAMSGVAALAASPIPVPVNAKAMLRAKQLAPDLRFTRERSTPAQTISWLKDPVGLKPDTTMPKIPLTEEELADVTAYLFNAELEPPPAVKAFVRLPVLERKVTFDEVDKKVFHRTCWHCHSDADFSIGDGGPGNSGGFGFKPRGLNLASYEGVAAGIKDKTSGERSSVLTGKKDAAAGSDAAMPLLLRSLVVRHAEEGGAETGEVRGMPLGMPPLSAEEIQLVESWIAQGRPR